MAEPKKREWWMIILGVVLLLVAVGNWFYPEDTVTVASESSEPSTETVSNPATRISELSESSERTVSVPAPAQGTTSAATGDSTKDTSSKKTTTEKPAAVETKTDTGVKQTTTTTPGPNRRDTGITLALLGSGLLFTVIGASGGKVTTIGLPGSVSVTLADAATSTTEIGKGLADVRSSIGKTQEALLHVSAGVSDVKTSVGKTQEALSSVVELVSTLDERVRMLEGRQPGGTP